MRWPALSAIAASTAAGRTPAVVWVAQALKRANDLGVERAGLATVVTARARLAAKRIDAAVKDGKHPGLLAGIPIVVKDNIAVAGHVPQDLARFGCVSAVGDALCVRRAEAAGAVVVATAQMAEWAMGVTGVNPHVPVLRHPYRLDRVPGGSSSGSTVAVALDVVPVALGTDTGGSVRIPAALCGVVGYRPGGGVLPSDGVVPVSPTYDRVGVLARRVADAEFIVRAIGSGPKPKSLGIREDETTRQLRVGLVTESLAEVEDPVASAAYREAILAVDGWIVEEITLEHWASAAEAAHIQIHAEAAEIHAERFAKAPELFGPDVRSRLEFGRNLSDRDKAAADGELRIWRAELDACFERFDVLASPTCAAGAPLLDAKLEPQLIAALSRATYAVSAGLGPAISVPCGVDGEGLSIGMQLFVRPGCDGQLIRAALALEEAVSLAGRGL